MPKDRVEFYLRRAEEWSKLGDHCRRLAKDNPRYKNYFEGLALRHFGRACDLYDRAAECLTNESPTATRTHGYDPTAYTGI